MEENKREIYEKPAIRTEEIELGVYGEYQTSPVPQLQPFFGLCPPCS